MAGFLLWQVWTRLEVAFAKRYCRKNLAEVCFIVLDWTLIPFAWRFLKQTRLPVHVRVADDPRVSASMMGWPTDVADRLDRAFAECYRLARSREVVSEGMRLHYQRRFACDATIVPPLNEMRIKRVSGRRKLGAASARLRVIHLGHLRHAERENLQALLSALSLLREEAAVDCSMDFFGRPVEGFQWLETPEFAAVHGWLETDVLQEYLRTADFSYVPYSFFQEHRVFVETSFPNKVSSSMKRGLPILFHGPAYSSVARFLGSYEAGVLLDTLDAREIARRLMAISTVDIGDMRAECLRAAIERFDEEAVFGQWSLMVSQLRDCGCLPT